TLVHKEERVNEGWDQLGSLCYRKLSLLPVLTDIVKDYARHEKDIYIGITEVRNGVRKLVELAEKGKISSDEKMKNLFSLYQEASSQLNKLSALVEAYPQLKADKNYLVVQQQIESTEDGIVAAKNTYNHRVRKYNQDLRTFPTNIIAYLFKFHPREYFNHEVGDNL
ncbi:MAG: hypothetical protein DRQ02_13505, partial [Candidatus Latescibacterota bacterium]